MYVVQLLKDIDQIIDEFHFKEWEETVNFFYRVKKILNIRKSAYIYSCEKSDFENISKRDLKKNKECPAFTPTNNFMRVRINQVFPNIDYPDKGLMELINKYKETDK